MSATRLIRDSAVTRWDDSVDVLILGFGCAGGSAAIEARRGGARVMIVERSSAPGGSSALSGGVIYCGGGTAIQRACGFEDSVEAMRAYLMASTGACPNEDKIDLYCRESAAHFDWMVSLGIPFKPSYWPHNYEPTTDDCLYYSGSEECAPFNQIARPAPRGHTVQAEGSCMGGGVMMRVIADVAVREGVEVLTDANCRALITSDDGSIIGAQVRCDGETRHIRARGGVVIATGGFIMNREMVARVASSALHTSPLGNPFDDGSGILLGEAAGGATANMHAAIYSCPVLNPPNLICGILLNERGQRFLPEDVNHKRLGEHTVLRQDGRIYLLVDSEVFEKPVGSRPIVATGDTPEELEDELGWPRGSIGATLQVYNDHARNGHDPLFGKKAKFIKPLDVAPYAVFDCGIEATGVYYSFTLGGLRTLPTGEVLTAEGNVLPGLYAIGRATSGLSAQSGGSSGLQLAEGTFFGRLTGRTIAAALHL
ncbi:FAD-dependent oxidoreductase [Sphingobium estronivorans]|uniref:FAD-dependent oxidoreductase n=1 Tax=Sphingobium estronivorans TaxID=1577690 RepID=UPI0012394CDB|nr:FAD-dependent oxidoreductase [Sphingobium estronivorans]